MSFTRWFLRLLPLFLIVHIVVNLALGYWDVRLSDHHFFQDQMSRIHYLQTMQAHLILGILMAVVLALIFASYYFKKQSVRGIGSIVCNQMALSIALVGALIAVIKVHLTWLDGHVLDPQGLLWTLVIFAAAIAFYWIVWSILIFLSVKRFGKWILYGVLAWLTVLTCSSAYGTLSRAEFLGSSSKTNILLIVIDTLRQDHVSPYGFRKNTTPFLDAFAKEAVQYQNAISQSPWTTPSHAALFTGQYPSKNGVDGRNIHLPSDETTLADVLSRNGYQTAGFINNVYIRRQTGLGQGFHVYEEFWGRNKGSSILLLLEFIEAKIRPRTDKGAAQTNQAVTNWLEHDWNTQNPFFLFVHYMEPHALYGSTKEYLHEFLPSGVSADQARKVNQDPELYICDRLQMSDSDFEILRALYDSDIRYLDQKIGELLDLFRKQKLMENTIVIVTADHGENFGEHHLMSHELSVYDTLLKVPLFIRFPNGSNRDSHINTPVQLIDIFPSLLTFLHIDSHGLMLQGSSLLHNSNQDRKESYSFAEYNNSRAVDKIRRRFGSGLKPNPLYQPKILKTVRSSDWKFVWGTDGTRELYSLIEDPDENFNVFQTKPQEAQQMELVLRKWISSFKPSEYYKREEMSNEALRELRSLGYIQ
jgi:arylsulfatase A-like enzyme